MHVLDSKIEEIEQRIKDVIKYAPEQEGTTMQETILAYGWILLDSWIAWRTLRFLIRKITTPDNVQQKWFQTPSSYTASQLGAVWGFNTVTEEYLLKTLGIKPKNIFDDNIQKKRNASAHCSTRSTDPNANISGADCKKIKDFFNRLSTIFLFYESKAFWEDVQLLLSQKGYGSLKFTFSNKEETTFDLSSLENSLFYFNASKGYNISIIKNSERYNITVKKDYCIVDHLSDGLTSQNGQVLKTSNGKFYDFLKNKGYYVNIEEFVEKLEEAIDASLKSSKETETVTH